MKVFFHEKWSKMAKNIEKKTFLEIKIDFQLRFNIKNITQKKDAYNTRNFIKLHFIKHPIKHIYKSGNMDQDEGPNIFIFIPTK